MAYCDLGEHLGRDRRVDRERDQRLAALGVAGDLHAGDVDAGLAEDAADGADHAGAVVVGEEGEVLGGLEVDVVAVDLDQPLALVDADQGAADRDLRAVGEGAADGDQVAVVGALGVGDQAHGDAALGGEQRRVHVGDLRPRRCR